jgi:hypothetical protein
MGPHCAAPVKPKQLLKALCTVSDFKREHDCTKQQKANK